MCKYNSHFSDFANSMVNEMSRKSHFWSSLSQLLSHLVKSAKGWILRRFESQNDKIVSEQTTQKNTPRPSFAWLGSLIAQISLQNKIGLDIKSIRFYKEEVGFEPTVRSHVRRFSRPLRSTAPAFLRTIVLHLPVNSTQNILPCKEFR